jgi:PEGA domain-containing protein
VSRRALLVLVALAACGGRKAEPRVEVAGAAPDAATMTVTPGAAQVPLPRAPGGGRPRLHLSLRSTPPGAAATVDGRLVGETPVRWEMEDDGRVHEFAFVLSGYDTWRLRFSPSHDGVVHAPLRAVGSDVDAGQGSTQ